MANDISNYDDVIDSRDVIARIEELQEERDDLQTAIDEAEETLEDASEDEREDMNVALGQAQNDFDDWVDENGAELAALESLAEEAAGYAANWHHGATLIRDSYFRDYAMQFADDLGCMDSNQVNTWPFTCIDWDQAAEELQADFSAVEFDGITYWVL